jgi:hypothetical protein
MQHFTAEKSADALSSRTLFRDEGSAFASVFESALAFGSEFAVSSL